MTTLIRKASVEWGVASRALPGQKASGDLWVVKPIADGALAAVVDGLGHGDEAAAVARIAAGILNDNAAESIFVLVKQCHEALMSTRGVVMTVVSINNTNNTVTALGVGNVEAVLLRSDSLAYPRRETFLLRSGVVGYQLPALYDNVFPIHPGDLLILCTDGVDPGFTVVPTLNDSPQLIAERILDRHFKGTDDALVLVVRYRGTRRE